MKLNIGCGYNYLAGYVNIDSGADSLADRKMDAQCLDFEDSSAAEIKASQLIEHLGFFKTKYFLAECRRVLEPGGLLILETPFVEKTFEIFLRGGGAEKEEALGWVYGSETAGMNHRYCFPEELLKELAGEAGFELRGTEHFDYQRARPALRLTLAKAVSESADLEAAFRRALTFRDAVLYGDEYAAAEQEKLIKACRAPAIFNDNEKVFELALYQPDLAAAFFSAKHSADREAGVFLKAAESLAGTGFTALMYGALRSRPLEENQRTAFDAALDAGREGLKNALARSRSSDLPGKATGGPRTLARLEKAPGVPVEPSEGPDIVRYPAIFSYEMSRLCSKKAFCAGLKACALRDLPKADALFKEALAFYRDDPAVWLRLGRNLTALGESGTPVPAYKKALELLSGAGPSGAAEAEALSREIADLLR